jgi:hypothetical protein
MFFRSICLLFVFSVSVQATFGQQEDFCRAVTAIMRDAPDKFRNIRGNVTESNYAATMWATGIHVPGTIGSRFVSSAGLFYEGAFLQTTSKNELKPIYDKYKALLADCLTPKGYTVSLSDNFYAGLGDYKKVAFMPELKDSTTITDLPSHVTMEVTYNKDVGKYTVVMYIFEH